MEQVELQVVACGQTAFVAESTELGSEFDFLSKNYGWKSFYKGRDILDPLPFGGLFQKPYSSKVPFYYEALFEAGIVRRLREEEATQRLRGRRPAVDQWTRDFSDKMTMGGCIDTLFILCSALVGLSGLGWVIECRRRLRRAVCSTLELGRKAFRKVKTFKHCNKLRHWYHLKQ